MNLCQAKITTITAKVFLLFCFILATFLFQYFRGQSDKGDLSMKDSDLEGTGMFSPV